MRIPFRFLLIALALGEIATFILVGKALGVFATLGLTLLSTIAGITLLRRQGVSTLTRLRADIHARRAPAGPLAEGAMLAAGAALMIVPGFLTSALGLLLFVPPARGALWRRMSRSVQASSASPAAFRPARTQIELGKGDYGATKRHDSPWQPGDADGQR